MSCTGTRVEESVPSGGFQQQGHGDARLGKARHENSNFKSRQFNTLTIYRGYLVFKLWFGFSNATDNPGTC